MALYAHGGSRGASTSDRALYATFRQREARGYLNDQQHGSLAMTDSELIQRAWRSAAADLAFRVTSPFTLRAADRMEATFLVLVHGFGSRAGTLVCTPDEFQAMRPRAKEHGYFLSGLYPEAYRRYDRERFVETLTDWGWYGDGPPPEWYTAAIGNR